MRLVSRLLPTATLAALLLPARAAEAGSVPIQTEDQKIAWNFPAVPLPPEAHFGATLALGESEPDTALAFIGAPDGPGGQRLELGPDDSVWSVQSTLVGGSPEPLAVDVDGAVYVALLDTGGATTSIRRLGDTGPPLVSGIGGGPVRSLVIHRTRPGSGQPDIAFLAFGQPDFFGEAGRVRIYEQTSAGSWVHAQTFAGAFGSRLGTSLAADERRLVAGAPKRGDNGAVHAFTRATSWIELQVINSPASGQTGAAFGAAVALDGGHLAVGSPFLNRNTPPPALIDAGGVYIYDALTFPFLQYQIQALLRPPGLTHYDWFGASVDVLVRTPELVEMVAGAPGDDDGAANSGAVYRYQRQGLPTAANWQLLTQMVHSAPVDLEQLGTTVALGAIGVLAGAPFGNFGRNGTPGLVLFFDARMAQDGVKSGDTSAWSVVEP